MRNRLNKNKGINIYIKEDNPQKEEKKHQFLRPYVQAAWEHKMRADLIGDFLLVEGNQLIH